MSERNRTCYDTLGKSFCSYICQKSKCFTKRCPVAIVHHDGAQKPEGKLLRTGQQYMFGRHANLNKIAQNRSSSIVDSTLSR